MEGDLDHMQIEKNQTEETMNESIYPSPNIHETDDKIMALDLSYNYTSTSTASSLNTNRIYIYPPQNETNNNEQQRHESSKISDSFIH